jgi:hypothetical protein
MYSTTDEITPTLNREEYRTRLARAVRKIAAEMSTDAEASTADLREDLRVHVTEHLTAIGGVYLTHPVSVIEHAEASLSQRGASHLGDVATTEDFAQEHARDLYEQEIVGALEQVLEGATVAGVRKATPDDAESPFVITSNADEQEIRRQHVQISPQTALRAREELRSHIEYSDDEMDTAAAEEAIEDLEQSLQADAPRTRVEKQEHMEEVVVPGVPRGTLTIDYGRRPPRAVIHTDDDTVLEPAVRLPGEDDADSSGGTETDASNRGGD